MRTYVPRLQVLGRAPPPASASAASLQWIFLTRRAQRPGELAPPVLCRLLARISNPVRHKRLPMPRRGGRAPMVATGGRGRSVVPECIGPRLPARSRALQARRSLSPRPVSIAQAVYSACAQPVYQLAASAAAATIARELQLLHWCNRCLVRPWAAKRIRDSSKRAARRMLGSSSIAAASTATQANGMPRKSGYSGDQVSGDQVIR